MTFRNLCQAFHHLKLPFHHLKLSLHHLVMPFDQVIFGKIIKIVTRRLKCTKCYFGWGNAPNPAAGSCLQRSQTSYLDLRG